MLQQTAPEIKASSDSELLHWISRGQLPAFSELYDRYAERLFGLALKILQNRIQAEDVIQDVFTNVWKKADSYQHQRGTVPGWLMIMCRNRCIDLKRSATAQRQHLMADDQSLDRMTDMAGKDPFEQTSDRQKSVIVQSALQKLPDEQRQLIELSYFGGFSQSEIAGKLALPLGTIKTRMRLAMQKLRSHFINTGKDKT